MKKRLLAMILAMVALTTISTSVASANPDCPIIDPLSITLPPIVFEIDDEC